jgi:hypothetical protein
MPNDQEDIEILIDFWDNNPTIASQTPLTFPNGAELGSYRGRCKVCNEVIDDDYLRGSVTHPIDKVYVVKAVGLCDPCKTITEFNHRVRDDLSLEWVDANGEWQRRAPRKNLRTKLLSMIGLNGRGHQ